MSWRLALLLLPLFIGYMIPPAGQRFERWINRLIDLNIYVILFLMGINLSLLQDLSHQLIKLSGETLVLFGVLAVCNITALFWFAGNVKKTGIQAGSNFIPTQNINVAIFNSIGLIGTVIVGVLLGSLFPRFASLAGPAAQDALFVLLALVGHQLRHSGISLRRALINRQGVSIASIVLISSLLAGLICAPLLHLHWATSLALMCGFGWYSLSGILVSDHLGAYYGGLAFLNDLARELFAMLIMPLLARRSAACGIGYCGSTSLDVTLPIIRRVVGIEFIPTAIVSGFLLSLAAPTFLLLFLSFAKP